MADALRRRLDTACTADSRDSGIEVRRMRPPRKVSKNHLSGTPAVSPEAIWDIATILWLFVFGLTVYVFHLPMSIWFSDKVDWMAMNASLVCYTLSLFCGCVMYVNLRTLKDWARRSPGLYKCGMLFFLAGSICFCYATYPLFGLFSAGICFVTLMFFLSLSELLA